MALFQTIKEKNTPKIQKAVYLICSLFTSLIGLLMLIVPFCYGSSYDNVTPLSFFSTYNDPDLYESGIAYLTMILFIVWCVYAIFVVGNLLQLIGSIGGDIPPMQKKAQIVCIINTVSSFLYFIGGVIFNIINSIMGGGTRLSNNIWLFAVILAVDVLLAIYIGLTRNDEPRRQEKTERTLKLKKLGRIRWELFLYVLLIAVCAVFCCLTDIISVTFTDENPAFEDMDFTLQGLSLLQDPAQFGASGQTLAFLVLLLLTTVSTLLLCSFLALLSKSRTFFHLSLATVLTGAIGCFLIGMYGKYFEMLQDANMELVIAFLQNSTKALGLLNGLVDLDSARQTLTDAYTVESTSYIVFLAVLIPTAIVLVRRPYSKGLVLERELFPISGGLQATVDRATISIGAEQAQPAAPIASVPSPSPDVPSPAKDTAASLGDLPGALDADAPKNADPCPAFTEIDGMIGEDQAWLEEHQSMAFEEPTLPKLVSFVVQYAKNSRLHLSYTEEDIAAFLAGLGAARLTILQGMSGTGKTSLPKIVTEALGATCNIIEVESSWRDKNELIGYYNEFSRIYTPKKFTQALYRASLHPERLTFIVLDEMNLSRIEYYFSDFLSLMENEPDRRELKLLNVGLFRTVNGQQIPYAGLERGHTVKIPENIWFIGTANRDESTFEISDKVYDRAHTMNFNKRAKKVIHYSDPMSPRFVSASLLNRLLEEAKQSMPFSIDDYPLIAEVEKLLAPYNISFGNRIALQIESFVSIYCACFAATEDVIHTAVERILLSKVVCKLELKSVEDKDELASAFDDLGLHRCSEFISKLGEE